jgi:CheY-like chemotaxis protein
MSAPDDVPTISPIVARRPRGDSTAAHLPPQSNPAETWGMIRQAVLLISDIDPQIFSLRQLLTRHHYDVRVAKSAEDAMHQLHLEPRFGLVICDLAIRKTDALDLMARILRVNYSTDQGILPPPKIIALTTPAANDAKATARTYREIALYTNHNVITKPVDPLVLMEKIESLIGAPARLPSRDAPLPEWTGESLVPAAP